eukprot:6199596-Pleurochrysis_carterae.AAC.1
MAKASNRNCLIFAQPTASLVARSSAATSLWAPRPFPRATTPSSPSTGAPRRADGVSTTRHARAASLCRGGA